MGDIMIIHVTKVIDLGGESEFFLNRPQK